MNWYAKVLLPISLGLALVALAGTFTPDDGPAPPPPPTSDTTPDPNLDATTVTVAPLRAFSTAFASGDELFSRIWTPEMGVGARVGDGTFFTRVPRADLRGPRDWYSHVPARLTGPNEASCKSCHDLPFEGGAGTTDKDIIRDPLRLADPTRYLHRQAPHLAMLGAVQRLGEEMTEDLQTIRDQTLADACLGHTHVLGKRLSTMWSIQFGFISIHCHDGVAANATTDCSQVAGVDCPSLVVKPFGWKGNVRTIREFVLSAYNQELGLQPREIVGTADADFDGVISEVRRRQVTDTVIYLAAQPRPVEVRSADPAIQARIDEGSKQFRGWISTDGVLHGLNCWYGCHSGYQTIREAEFREGRTFFDLGIHGGRPLGHEGTTGRASIQAFTDLKRHNMGPDDCDPVDETGTGPCTWLTRSLWGVGSTAPYMHDGASLTLDAAIIRHGGDAAPSRDLYLALTPEQKEDVALYLGSLQLREVP